MFGSLKICYSKYSFCSYVFHLTLYAKYQIESNINLDVVLPPISFIFVRQDPNKAGGIQMFLQHWKDRQASSWVVPAMQEVFKLQFQHLPPLLISLASLLIQQPLTRD